MTPIKGMDSHHCRYTFRGGQYSMQCPSHGDDRALLTLRNGGAKVLLRCHVGYTAKQILDALNLNWPELFDLDDTSHHAGKPEIVTPIKSPGWSA